MEDENLLDDELARPSTNVDSPATFSRKLIRKFGICHGSTGTDAVTNNNNITCYICWVIIEIVYESTKSLVTLVLNSRDQHKKYGFLRKMRLKNNLTTTFSFNILPYNLLVRCY